MEIKWVGLLQVAFKTDDGQFWGGILRPDIEIGIRDDGVLVWRNSPDKMEDVNSGYCSKVETVEKMPESPIAKDDSSIK